MHQDPEDSKWMRHAISLAKRGLGSTSPNPPVGAVLVKNGEILGEGWHECVGGPHAEINALKSTGWPNIPTDLLRTATLYVTLEPCSTHGRTGPCTESILAAGIGRVVWGSRDPNPPHQGRAEQLLSHLSLTTGVEAKTTDALLRPWAHFIRTGRPWIIAKSASTLDGRISREIPNSPWITSPRSRQHAMRRYRRRVDAILIGAETLRKDNPQLTYRGSYDRPPLWRVILTRSGNLPRDAKVFTDSYCDRTLVYREPVLLEMLRELAARGVVSLLLEGGGQLQGAFFKAGLVDEIAWYVAPEIGLKGTASVTGSGTPIPLTKFKVKSLGRDLWIRALVKNSRAY